MPQKPIQSDPRVKRYLDYPYAAGATGAPKTTGADDHLRDLILQVLFTNPGERVNLPDFGAGVYQLVFAPNGASLRSSAQFMITTNLQRWLGDRIKVNQVEISSVPGEEERVMIEITYTELATLQRQNIEVRL